MILSIVKDLFRICQTLTHGLVTIFIHSVFESKAKFSICIQLYPQFLIFNYEVVTILWCVHDLQVSVLVQKFLYHF